MTCDAAQDIILELQPPDTGLSMHLAGCEACRGFLATQQALDAQLARSYRAPDLSPQFRTGLRQRISNEKANRRSEAPMALIAPCAALVTSGLCELAAPDLAAYLFTAGLALSVLSYFGQILFVWMTEELGEG